MYPQPILNIIFQKKAGSVIESLYIFFFAIIIPKSQRLSNNKQDAPSSYLFSDDMASLLKKITHLLSVHTHMPSDSRC